MSTIVLLSSSPLRPSRLEAITTQTCRTLSDFGHRVRTIYLRDVPHSALMAGNDAHPRVRSTHRYLDGAETLVAVTPTYHLTASATLLGWLDLVPRATLTGLAVQAISIGTARSHAAGMDATLAAKLRRRAPASVLPGCFVDQEWLTDRADGWVPNELLTTRIAAAASAVSGAAAARTALAS
ncbi:NADPH-dependent FMN reductase [Tamaricihabitans halophyticus]|uniref:NADPH-dependent FMN reductase n=1 Tax=Tamaricihabitans halophyticus TaxID=1262583 RepID=A0A4R2QCR0_9PSEU|nr:NAD(P)H-dependent oxidoreductase [Tamaricihabitans halophyticus]TCP46822.1 NADPH-dependent FMN reductase [Tamaricihabitans halophyticus]